MPGTMFQSKGMKAFGRYGSVGFELIASMGVGYYGGRWLDGKLGTHWLAAVGFLLGVYTGFRALWLTAKRMERDIANDEALERGEDPWAPKPKESAGDDPGSDDPGSDDPGSGPGNPSP